MTRFINLTPHKVTVMREPRTIERYETGDHPITILDLPSAIEPFRAEQKDRQVTRVGDIHITEREFEMTHEVLPPKIEETLYVVSLPALMIMRAAGITRGDFVAPDTGNAFRSDSGKIMGVPGFISMNSPLPSWVTVSRETNS